MNIKHLRTYLSVFIILVSFSMILACEYASEIFYPEPPSEEIEEKINIGVVVPRSGRLEQSFGLHIENALTLAIDEINSSQFAGVQLNLIFEDSQSTVVGAVAAFEKLIKENGVSVILGPATSTATKETFPIAGDNQVVVISPTSAARGLSAISDYAFRIALTTDVLVPYGVAATHERHMYERVATIYDVDDAFSTDADEALQETFNSLGIEVVARETFIGGETSFLDQLTRIKAFEPDAIFISSLPPEKSIFLRESVELGITAPIILRTLTDADVDAAGEASEGAITYVGWSTAVDTPGNQTFMENYTTAFGIAPNNYAARTYAAIYVLGEGIRNASSYDADSIKNALANIRDFDTVMGKFSFDENGDAIYEPQVLIVRDGKLEQF